MFLHCLLNSRYDHFSQYDKSDLLVKLFFPCISRIVSSQPALKSYWGAKPSPFWWADIKRDIKALQEITIDDNGKTLMLRSECLGTCGKVFQWVGIAIPPVIREVA